jgi:transcriptional regulator with XRE-family HTH domain
MRAMSTVSPRPAPLGRHLKQLRSTRRLSQLELSLRVGVSQRHLSCIETGRARASRAMLLAVLDALDAPLAERNNALLAAGYAPVYGQRPLAAADMAPVREALSHLLKAHEPAPAMVLDEDWNLVQANAGVGRLLRLLGVDAAVFGPGANLLRLTLMPGGLAGLIVNAGEVCAEVFNRAQREAAEVPALASLVEELRPAAQRWLERADAASAAPSPLLYTCLRAAAGGELRFFSTFTTFGAPLDVTAASLRVEHLFPADDATRSAFQGPLASS